MVTDLCHYLTYDSRGAWNAMLLLNYEMLPEIHTMEKCDSLRPIVHSQII